MKQILLKAEKLSKSFYHPKTLPILKEVSLEISGGTSTAIMGRSGEGKSTLLHVLGTLDNPCTGTLEIAGNKVLSSNRNQIRNQHIAFVFQSFFLLEDYTALENVLMPAAIARVSTRKGSLAYTRGLELLEKVGLSERAHYQTKRLSGGEKQRVAIARALCNDPSILFADEPSGNLDRESAKIIHNLLLDFAKDPSKATILVTHDPELASLCSTTYTLKECSLSS